MVTVYEGAKFDFIIIGAGSAGAVLANRLTENGRFSVLLIEAGATSHHWSSIPISFAKFINNPSVNWLYSAEPEESSGQRRIEIPRGKLLGGSSSINGMVFVRGQSHDFDHWAQLGNKGWSFDEILPFFKKMETYHGTISAFRGTSGPLNVTNPQEDGPFYRAMFKAAQEIGIKRNNDYNAASQEGVGMTQATILNGKRQSTAVCYLAPATRRKNLTIITEAFAQKLIFHNNCCVGLEFRKKGKIQRVFANYETILSAGTINSPQLLELSGIGEAEVLKKAGIEPIVSLPGVGGNLRDHYAPRMKWKVKKNGYTYNDKARGVGLAVQALKYIIYRNGFLALPAAPMRAYVCSREGLSSPDVGISVNPFLVKNGVALAKESGFTMAVHVLRSESTGTVHISSPKPNDPPKIHFNFLSDKGDQDALISGMNIVREWINSKALKEIRGIEIAPGEAVQSDTELLSWVKNTAETTYHPVGTCKMGNDSMAVVDAKLKTHGVNKLRVVDASIMPTLTSGNTNAPTIMIAEKAADMIIKDWK